MIRTLILLVATLAALALAAPAPRQHSKSFNGGASSKHSFKSRTRGHGRNGHHRDPLTELTRVYNKFHWSITWGDATTVTWPQSGSAADAYGSAASSSVPSYGAEAAYGTEASQVAEPSFAADAYNAAGSSSYAETSPDAVTSTVNASSNAIATSTAVTFTTSVSATAAATAEASSSGTSDGEVTATPEENDSEYLSPVSVGGQQLNLNFDTGSADL